MKYAVIYQSKSGNTKLIAEEIYKSIDVDEKVIFDIDESDDLPDADFYFIGFGIHHNTCGIDISILLQEKIFTKYALFITCGLCPTESYCKKLMRNISVWLPEEEDPVNIFFCQAKTEKHIQESMISKMPRFEERFQEVFRMGNSHPDEEDLEDARDFVQRVIELNEER